MKLKFTLSGYTILLILTTLPLLAQEQPLKDFNNQSLKYSKKGMLVLGSWAIANIAVGVAGTLSTEGDAKYFHQMNAIWNGINLGLAAGALYGIRHKNVENNSSLATTVKEQYKMEKTFLFNGALDLVYITGGLYLRERSMQESGKKKDILVGYGNSVILQGGFLLLFDSIMYLVLKNHTNKNLIPILEKISFSSSGVGFNLTMN